MRAVWLALLLTGCLRDMVPNTAPRVVAINGREVPRWEANSPNPEPLQFRLGQTLEIDFTLEDRQGHDIEVLFPEPHPGWHWDPATTTVTWDVPTNLVDPDTSALMILRDDHPSDPRHTVVWLGLWSPDWPVQEDVDDVFRD